MAARILEVDGRITWFGAVDYSQLGACYQTSDVFVFPSLEDIIGMVVLEAMVFGKPVLCSDQAGAKDMVRGRQKWICFQPERCPASRCTTWHSSLSSRI